MNRPGNIMANKAQGDRFVRRNRASAVVVVMVMVDVAGLEVVGRVGVENVQLASDGRPVQASDGATVTASEVLIESATVPAWPPVMVSVVGSAVTPSTAATGELTTCESAELVLAVLLASR